MRKGWSLQVDSKPVSGAGGAKVRRSHVCVETSDRAFASDPYCTCVYTVRGCLLSRQT